MATFPKLSNAVTVSNRAPRLRVEPVTRNFAADAAAMVIVAVVPVIVPVRCRLVIVRGPDWVAWR